MLERGSNGLWENIHTQKVSCPWSIDYFRISDFVNDMNENERDELMVLKFLK